MDNVVQEQEQYSAPEASPSPAQSSGTLCRQNSEFHLADCCNVCQALENSLVLVPELAHLRIFIFLRYTNVLIIIIIIITILPHMIWP